MIVSALALLCKWCEEEAEVTIVHNWCGSMNFTVHFPSVLLLCRTQLTKYLHIPTMDMDIWASLCRICTYFHRKFALARSGKAHTDSSRQTTANDETTLAHTNKHTHSAKLQNEGEKFVTSNWGYRSIVTQNKVQREEKSTAPPTEAIAEIPFLLSVSVCVCVCVHWAI